jgi:branched-chain amino acid transport system substrate-binding protein
MRSFGVLGRAISLVAAVAVFGTVMGTAQAATTYKIGVDLPMSGADASNGIPTNNGVILAVDEANAKGLPGGIKLQVQTLDDAVQGVHDPAAGAQNIKTFVSDASVMGVVGPFNSNVAQAEIPISNDAGLAQISPSNTNDGLTIGEAAKKLRQTHPNEITYFRVCTRDHFQGAAGAASAKKLGYKKVYIVDDNETYGKGLADVFEAAFKAGGGTVLGHDHLTKNQQDFKALLTKIKSTNPDAVFFGGVTATGGGLLRRQMADAGMAKVPYIGGDGISDEEFLKVAGSMADNSYYTVAAPDVAMTSAQAFNKAYRAKFHSAPGPYSAAAYTAANVIIAAIVKANKAGGVTRAAVLKNIASTKGLPSPIGTVGFDKNGDTTNGVISFYKISGTPPKAKFLSSINVKPSS